MRYILLVTISIFFFTVLYSLDSSAQMRIIPHLPTGFSGGNQQSGIFSCQNEIIRVQTVIYGKILSPGDISFLNMRGIPGSTTSGPIQFPELVINMSTTNINPGNLERTFANNVGTDENGDAAFSVQVLIINQLQIPIWIQAFNVN